MQNQEGELLLSKGLLAITKGTKARPGGRNRGEKGNPARKNSWSERKK